MSRIHDALKKAEQERSGSLTIRERIRLACDREDAWNLEPIRGGVGFA